MNQPEALVNELVALGLISIGGTLYAKKSLRDTPGIQQRCKNALFVVYRFDNGCDSRWITHGTSSQMFCGGTLIGVEQAVKRAIDHGHKYNLGPFKRRHNKGNRTVSLGCILAATLSTNSNIH